MTLDTDLNNYKAYIYDQKFSDLVNAMMDTKKLYKSAYNNEEKQIPDYAEPFSMHIITWNPHFLELTDENQKKGKFPTDGIKYTLYIPKTDFFEYADTGDQFLANLTDDYYDGFNPLGGDMVSYGNMAHNVESLLREGKAPKLVAFHIIPRMNVYQTGEIWQKVVE